MQMEIGPANTGNAIRPTANCEYNLSNGGPNGIPNLTKSFSFELWTNQTNAAARIYSGLEINDMNPYRLTACEPVSVEGIGEQATWSGGSGCTGPKATGFLLVQSNTSNLFILWGLQLGASMTEARHIVIEMGGSNSSGGSASSTPTTTVPPTTTTTTLFTQEQQKFVDDIESQFPAVAGGISNGPGNITVASLVNNGEIICTGLGPQFGSGGIIGGYDGQQNYISVSARTTLPYVDETSFNGQTIVSLAIEDICPMHLSDIPPGDPGAS